MHHNATQQTVRLERGKLSPPERALGQPHRPEDVAARYAPEPVPSPLGVPPKV